MNQQEQIQYLANIYNLAAADENFQVEEDYLLQEIAKGIGAGYLETRKALDLSGQKDFTVKLPHRYSERLRCLEDMLFVALSDKKLHVMEKETILTFAKQLGINQEQMDIIRKETKERLKALGK
ncbi:MAG: TerB family tellurite resistance protein [Phycisphaerae bacterium]|nr:TerB family tellurite resistance protein [Phycisphaerae bacterium]